jgi:hypothetical protein
VGNYPVSGNPATGIQLRFFPLGLLLAMTARKQMEINLKRIQEQSIKPHGGPVEA